MSEKNFDVFISHSSKDAHAASAIKQHLQSCGIRCWKAPDDIMPGESWPQAILRAISNSHTMVLVWSTNSTSSGEVSKELTLAMRNNLIVVPFRIENVSASGEWEYHLANTHWMDAFAGKIEQHLDGLASYINRIIPDRDEKLSAEKNSPEITKSNETKQSNDQLGLLEKLVDSAIQDGVVTDEEMIVLQKRASSLGIDQSELDLLIKSKLDHQKDSKKIVSQQNENPPLVKLTTTPLQSTETVKQATKQTMEVVVQKKLWLAYVLVIIFGLFGYCYTSFIRAIAIFVLWVVALFITAAIGVSAGKDTPLDNFAGLVAGLMVPFFWYIIPLIAIKVWGFRQGVIPKKL